MSDGILPGVYAPSISAPTGQLPFTYEATAAVAYFDENRNGRLDGQPTVLPCTPAFPYSKRALMPTFDYPQGWVLEDSNLVDAVQGRPGNIVMYAELPRTHGARAASQHISLHMEYDGQQLKLISILAGDLFNPFGHLMVAPSVRPISTTFDVRLPALGSPGRITGVVEADLQDHEYYSYLNPRGSPGLGRLAYTTTVRFHFDSPMVAQ